MANFNRNNRSGSGDGFRSGGFKSGGGFRDRGFRDRDSSQRMEMHKAVCDNCGKDCEVPFRPTSGKPVFCSSCFKSRGDSNSRRPEGRNFEGPRFGNRDNNVSRDSGQSQSQIEIQLNELNNKMDKLLKLLSPKTTVVAEKPTEEIVETTPKKAKKSK